MKQRKHLAIKLLTLRKRRGWSQYKAAKEAGIFAEQLRRLEDRKYAEERETGSTSVKVAAGLLRAFKPDLKMADFL